MVDEKKKTMFREKHSLVDKTSFNRNAFFAKQFEFLFLENSGKKETHTHWFHVSFDVSAVAGPKILL